MSQSDCIACLRGLIGECEHDDSTSKPGTDGAGIQPQDVPFDASEEGEVDSGRSPSRGTQATSSEDESDAEAGYLSKGRGSYRRTSKAGAGTSEEGSKRQRRNKRDAALRDQQSTGRKRAARLYPLDRSADCEWAGNPGAGGGDNPIPGCGIEGRPVGKQQARHHGPDKNTLNNEPGNVHRICHGCHNRWHAVNDPDYVWGAKVKGD